MRLHDEFENHLEGHRRRRLDQLRGRQRSGGLQLKEPGQQRNPECFLFCRTLTAFSLRVRRQINLNRSLMAKDA